MNLFEIFSRLSRFLRQYPVIILPFLLMGFFDLVLLVILFYVTRPPVSSVIEPFIRSFWGEKYLHYPANLLLLPEIFGYGKSALMFVTGLIASGATIAMIFQISNKIELNWRVCASKALSKYLGVFFIWALVITVNTILIKILGNFNIIFRSPKHIFMAELFAGLAAQMIFIYAIPSIIIENKKIFLSIKRTLFLVKKYPLISLAIILLPNLLLMPLYYIHYNITYLVSILFPEVVLWALIARITFTTAVDFIVTSSAALGLLMYKELENRNIVS